MRRKYNKNLDTNNTYLEFKKFFDALETLNGLNDISLINGLNRYITKGNGIDYEESVEEPFDALSKKLYSAIDSIKRVKENKEKIQPKAENLKNYSPEKAGIYIQEKLQLTTPYTKAQVNIWIRGGKMKSIKWGKNGNYNRIEENELNDFIERERHNLRKI